MKSLGMILTFAALLSACVPGSKSGDEAGPDARVARGHPAVITEPKNAPVRPFRAAVLPFSASGAAGLSSKGLTAVLVDAWTREQAFDAVYYEPDQVGLTNDQAILMARDRGADCVVIGRLGGLVDGDDGEDSAASLSFEILDVNSGQAIWSMTASGRMGPGVGFSFFRPKSDPSGDALKTIVAALAYDTGAIIKKWNTGAAYSTPGAVSVPVSVPDEHAPPPPPKKPLQSSNLSS